jgi:hypothetical protein
MALLRRSTPTSVPVIVAEHSAKITRKYGPPSSSLSRFVVGANLLEQLKLNGDERILDPLTTTLLSET